MPYKIEVLGAADVDGIWPMVSEHLDHACWKTGGAIDATYLWSECRSGRAFLMIVIGDDDLVYGAAVWQFQHWQTGRKLKCLAMFGKRTREWIGEMAKLTAMLAKVGQASTFVCDAREGWGKWFPKAKKLFVTYEMEVNDV